ncbi:hypothetical protein L611_004300000230 [Aminobacter sp. J15]|nr:hypothetical protein L611_004300000230 [Aminobacter sp. J15]
MRKLLRSIRSMRQLFTATILALSLLGFLSSNQFAALQLAFNFWDPFSISQYRLSKMSREDYEAAIEDALEEGDVAEAQDLVSFARENGLELPAELVDRTLETSFEFGVRNARDFVQGAITGDVSNAASLSGALAADYTGVGDVRDVMVQGNRVVRGEEYDPLILGFAVAGLATAAPGTGAVDVGLSIVKNAKKANRLNDKLLSSLVRSAVGVVNVERLKSGLSRLSLPEPRMPSAPKVLKSLADLKWQDVTSGDLSRFRNFIIELAPVDVGAAKKAVSGAVRKEALSEIKLAANAAAGIVEAGGVKAAFRVMEHAEDARDLSRFQSMAGKMGSKTSAAIRVLGREAIYLGRLVYAVFVALGVLLGWSIGVLWLAYKIFRACYRVTRRVGGLA